jgi:dTDP-glucose pyrophosphorylase
MNIVVPVEQIAEHSGPSAAQSHQHSRPADLRIIDGKPWLEFVIDTLPPPEYARYIFTIQESCQRMFFLAELIRLHRPQAEVIIVPDGAKGPACAVLMASEHLADGELCIVPANQFLRCDFREVIEELRRSQADVGAVTFDSLHPRWPHIQLDEEGEVMEVSETSLLSRSALAGIYYFRKSGDFLRAAEQVIRKDNHVQGRFNLAPTLNELILAGKRICCASIAAEDFVPLCTEADFCELPHPSPRRKPAEHRPAQFRVYSPPA